jgi:uncharacterized protein (UPF0548 family)
MPLLHLPEIDALNRWLASLHEEPLSYSHGGGVDDPPLSGFIPDRHLVLLGNGEEVYQRACKGLDSWSMFPAWTLIFPLGASQKPGQIVAMTTRILGLWWINPCRILSRCDASKGGVRRHGFVYGTLPQHAECGEERFWIEMLPDGTVWYHICAFSRPQHWLAWLGFPVARWWQLRFVRDSQAAMLKLTQSSPATEP